MIYLFCNTGYGNSFLRKFIKYAKENKMEGTVVFSGNQIRLIDKNFKRIVLYRIKELIRLCKNNIRELIFSKRYGVKVIFVYDINAKSFSTKIKKNDVGIIAGFNQIFKNETIKRFQKIVNFHPSLLPFYRGPVPSYWCIQNGEKYTGFTLHQVTAKIDEGEILYQETLEIGGIKEVKELDLKIAQLATPAIISFLDYTRGNRKWNSKIVEAEKFYIHQINYISFPKTT